LSVPNLLYIYITLNQLNIFLEDFQFNRLIMNKLYHSIQKVHLKIINKILKEKNLKLKIINNWQIYKH